MRTFIRIYLKADDFVSDAVMLGLLPHDDYKKHREIKKRFIRQHLNTHVFIDGLRTLIGMK